MIEKIKLKLINVILESSNLDTAKARIKGIIKFIEEYQESDKTLTDVHSVFRALEEYNVMYNNEIAKYGAMEKSELAKCSYQLQEIICILAMMGSLLNNILRKYNTAEDKSTLAKYLRRLNDMSEYVRGEKIMWQSVLKSTSTLISSDLEDKEYAPLVDE